MTNPLAISNSDKISKLEKNCKDAIKAKDILVCENPICILNRAYLTYGMGLICKYPGKDAAYAAYEKAKITSDNQNPGKLDGILAGNLPAGSV